MQRLTITLDDETALALDAFMTARGYSNRSEAIRDLLRGPLRDAEAAREPSMPCMAVVSYIYDHRERDLGRRLVHAQHEHHGLGVATLHTHLDHDLCLEVAVLRGAVAEVQDFAQALVRERGVRFGGANLLPAPRSPAAHDHPDATAAVVVEKGTRRRG
ncbi:nickel-responsive transcriptional regulator NikR [Roseomonas terrae]|jgi:CopG family nickel-responsive transcriptional regulator|uniref:Putative nickel-responsive regulator n=1 Tax=Neoroseomonas terrae TaxID=424799 RepID=A0ABS5EAS9_9PROT|nr:nickel-responsive transcriptional regulator NikR [Neoroseomonas terrae]MBR0648120.1 nickel-responsive transcriptional regulator NikR [Neoroseomonas terrae]